LRSAQAAGYYLRSLYSKAVNSPLFWQGLVIQRSVVSLFDSHIFFGA
jgi:hypothetical protein